jgi:protein-disulfide isomerase
MSKRRELVERRREKERRQTLIILGIIAVIAVVLVGGAIILSNKPETPVAASTAPLPPTAEANARAWGPADAPIKVVEWLDYQCPACGAYNRSFEAGVIEAFANTGKVRYEVHSISFIGAESIDAAQAALCAVDQNKFWQMHDALFANQQGENQGGFTKARLKTIAAAAGLDTGTFNSCLDSGKYLSMANQEHDDAVKLGVQQTPSFIVNGKLYPGTMSADDFKKLFAQIAPDVKF